MRLAERVLTRGGDDLAPQTRRLLAAAQAHRRLPAPKPTTSHAETVAFTRRELRETLGWSEHQVRIGLARLVALEYLVAVPGGAGPPAPLPAGRPARDHRPANPATPRDRCATPTRGVKTAPTLAERTTPRSMPTRSAPTVGQS